MSLTEKLIRDVVNRGRRTFARVPVIGVRSCIGTSLSALNIAVDATSNKDVDAVTLLRFFADNSSEQT